jgi:hypothetical protein
MSFYEPYSYKVLKKIKIYPFRGNALTFKIAACTYLFSEIYFYYISKIHYK